MHFRHSVLGSSYIEFRHSENLVDAAAIPLPRVRPQAMHAQCGRVQAQTAEVRPKTRFTCNRATTALATTTVHVAQSIVDKRVYLLCEIHGLVDRRVTQRIDDLAGEEDVQGALRVVQRAQGFDRPIRFIELLLQACLAEFVGANEHTEHHHTIWNLHFA